ncbi:MAG: hypothetical protein EP330_23585 [Deltaproteobacteria bacterium]|nr:MAG: hypothetical protein EP330_23585 [Deltaproteobacteria bacterium]
MFLLLLASLTLANPPAEEAPTATPGTVDNPVSASKLPGTVDKPLRIRVTRTSVERANDTLQREWGKVERALLDLQASLYGETDRASRSAGLEPGKPLRVRVERDLQVHVEVFEAEQGWRNVRLRVEDDAGEPVADVTRATVQTPGADEKELQLASSGEVVIENLEYAEGTAVRLYIGDGDVVLIWLEE